MRPTHRHLASEPRLLAALVDASVRRGLQVFVRHVPPRHKGMTAVALVNRKFPPSGRLLTTTYAEGIRITCDLRDSVQSSIFYRGVHEEPVTRLLLEQLRPGDTFCDLGANVGYFTLLASRAVGDSGQVHAFEPSSLLCARLRGDIARNSFAVNVTLHEVAVSDREGSAALVLPSEALSPWGEQYLADVPPADASSEVVPVVVVDDFLPDLRFDVAKIDVEGSDLRALRGMRKAIARSRPRLLLVEEADRLLEHFGDSVAELIGYLAELGYAPQKIGDPYDSPMLAFRDRAAV